MNPLASVGGVLGVRFPEHMFDKDFKPSSSNMRFDMVRKLSTQT
jgi:hypothetical protein